MIRRIARVVIMLALASCGPHALAPSAPRPLPAARAVVVDTSPKDRPRMVPPEAYLRAYLLWFGGLAPLDVQARARGRGLFDTWSDYLAALGLPDYRIDLPRQTQSNALMVAALGRLGEALCIRAAEHDLHDARTPPDARVVFAFDAVRDPDSVHFAARFDVLHRTFLGYPARLAPASRTARYLALFRAVAARHPKGPLRADETGWAAVCAALIQHPEAGLY